MKALKTLFLFILKILKNMFNPPPTLTPTAQEMFDYWKACPTADLSNLFFAEDDNLSIKAISYSLDFNELNQLFNNVQPGDDEKLNLRVFMGANPNTPYGEIVDIPSFTPIVQVYNIEETIPNSVNYNSMIAVWDPAPSIPFNFLLPSHLDKAKPSTDRAHHSDIPVSKGQAVAMITDWTVYVKENLYQLLEGAVGRIEWTTFYTSDTKTIRENFESYNSYDPKLFIHLGFAIPTNAIHPFGFRIVLELRVTQLKVSLFFEVSNPCPPLCIPAIPGGN